jgi:hypothetical protein
VIEDDDVDDLWKRGRQYWMDSVGGGQRYREPLHTTDWREAKEREKERLGELARRPADPAHRGRSYGALEVTKAIEAYAKEQRAQVSPRMVAYWTENARPLGEFFGTTPLRKITTDRRVPERESRRGPRAKDRQWRVICPQASPSTCATLVPIPRRLSRTEEHQTAGRPGAHG